MRKLTSLIVAAALLVAVIVVPPSAEAEPPAPTPSVSTLMSGIAGASGSTVGPDGALYVTESHTGSILRVDPGTGDSSVYATGLPTAIAPIGGPMDLVFHGNTAYVLVSLVGPFFGSPDPSGIYRMDGPSDWTVIADLGQWALDNPPGPDISFFIPTGVHYAIDTFRGGFVVSDAHHNKVLHVTRSGAITELAAYGNIVPTGLDSWGNQVLIAMSGPAPHLPQDGQILSLNPHTGESTLVAAGGRLLVDVERGRGATLFGLAQGFFTPGNPDGSPANPFTGELLRSDGAGGFTPVVGGLNLPTSMEIIGTTAYVVGLAGDITQVDHIAGPPFG